MGDGWTLDWPDYNTLHNKCTIITQAIYTDNTSHEFENWDLQRKLTYLAMNVIVFVGEKVKRNLFFSVFPH